MSRHKDTDWTCFEHIRNPKLAHPRHARNLAYNVMDDIFFGHAGARHQRAQRIVEAKAEAEAAADDTQETK